MLYPQDLLDELPRDSGAEQHTNDHPIQEVLDLGHAFVAITQGAVYAVIALRADGFMHSKLSLHCFHLQPLALQALRRPELLESIEKLLDMDVYPSNREVGLQFRLAVAVSLVAPWKWWCHHRWVNLILN